MNLNDIYVHQFSSGLHSRKSILITKKINLAIHIRHIIDEIKWQMVFSLKSLLFNSIKSYIFTAKKLPTFDMERNSSKIF